MFVNRWIRYKIFDSKQSLKGPLVVVGNWLTFDRMELFQKNCVGHEFKPASTRKGPGYAALSDQKH